MLEREKKIWEDLKEEGEQMQVFILEGGIKGEEEILPILGQENLFPRPIPIIWSLESCASGIYCNKLTWSCSNMMTTYKRQIG